MRTAKFRYPIWKAGARPSKRRRSQPEPDGPVTPRSPPTSKRCSTCRCRSRRCSAAPEWTVGDLLKLGPGTVLELDRKVGEAIDIYVNNRLVARGEVVLVEDKLGVTMTEIIKAEQTRDAR